MMKLGFVSAILADQSLDEVVRFAAANGFACVEAMCWPVGQAERRYAGVTHIDVTNLGDSEAKRIRSLLASANVELSALGYYPNPLCADEREAAVCIEHLKRVISAAPALGLKIVNTFVGRDPARSLAENWKLFDRRWPSIIEHAKHARLPSALRIVRCFLPTTNGREERTAVSPKIWCEMFRRIPARTLDSTTIPPMPSGSSWIQPSMCANSLIASCMCMPKTCAWIRIDLIRWAFWPRLWNITVPSCLVWARCLGPSSLPP
jgi:hypothetical protein